MPIPFLLALGAGYLLGNSGARQKTETFVKNTISNGLNMFNKNKKEEVTNRVEKVVTPISSESSAADSQPMPQQ